MSCRVFSMKTISTSLARMIIAILCLAQFLYSQPDNCLKDIAVRSEKEKGQSRFSSKRLKQGANEKGDAAQNRIIALVDCNVIDGTGKPLVKGQTIIIRGDRISAIGAKTPIPKEAMVVNLSGKTVIPGLIDMHGHLYANTKGLPMVSQFEAYSSLYLAGGVTSIRSPGEFDPEGAVAQRDRINNGEVRGPRMFISGPYFDNEPSNVPWIKGVRSPEEALQLFNMWKNRIDGVKFYMSITEPEFRAVLDAAHKHGLLATGHLDSISATRAIELGIDGLEHGIFAMSELTQGTKGFDRFCALADLDLKSAKVKELVKKIVDKRVVIDPTIITFQASLPDFEPVTPDFQKYFDQRVKQFYTESSNWAKTNIWEKNPKAAPCLHLALQHQLQFVKLVHDQGGIIVAGTDPVSVKLIPGYSLHCELRNLVEAGLTPIEAIKAATLDAATALRRQKDLGSIQTGKLADLVVITGDPSTQIEEVGKIETVFKGGIQYNPASLRKAVEEGIK